MTQRRARSLGVDGRYEIIHILIPFVSIQMWTVDVFCCYLTITQLTNLGAPVTFTLTLETI